MEVITNTDIKNDICDITRLFEKEQQISIFCNYEGNILYTQIKLNSDIYNFSDIINANDAIERKRFQKRHIKKHVYDVLKGAYGGFFPWGSLTGIRPAKLYGDTVIEMGADQADKYFIDFYDVSDRKLQLAKQIYNVRENLPLSNAQLYIGIPFCNGRCSYCSFFSADINKNAYLIDGYIDCLKAEIKCVKQIAREKNIKFDSVYIGGGTPSSIPINSIKIILEEVKDLQQKEFTVEAGRPDSISESLLLLLKEYGVNRISINPQTTKDSTLSTIGRNHTYNDFLTAFKLSKKYDFIINTDIIAGLPDENLNDFIQTTDSVADLKPHNITVHTLAIKKGAELKIQGYKHIGSVSEMVDYANDALNKKGYNAYYMYRQKNSAGNLENTGYALSGKECLYNIYNIGDDCDIYACGAGAISKKVCGGVIERQANPKDIITYCKKTDIIIKQKQSFF